jgi:hypothetical protein
MDDLYKNWSKTKKPLFNMLKMQHGLNEVLSEESKEIEINKKKLELSGTVELYEAFVKELIKDADAGRKARSKFIRIFYQGVLKTKGWILFNTPSQYTPGKKYFQYIKLLDTKDLKDLKDLKKKDIMRLLLAGNVSCYCSCLKNDTMIKLLDGRTISVKDMEKEFVEGKDLWVYSTDSKGDFKPGKVGKVWVTGNTKMYIKVTLDNGREIFTTENHPYMLRDGSYLRADRLEVGQSLMPMYFNYSKGYENVKLNSSNTYNLVYKLVSSNTHTLNDYECVRERCGEDKISIHHGDFNKLNNIPRNLELMGYQEYIKFHADFINERRKNDPEFAEKSREAARKNAVRRNNNNNHKVAKIEVINLEEEEPVYDIKVDKWENFYVDAGIVLHNCPDFLYKGFKFMGYNMGYGIYKEMRHPKIKNPRLEGTVCKHMLAVFSVLGMHWLQIHRDMVNSYFWKARYKEDEPPTSKK